ARTGAAALRRRRRRSAYQRQHPADSEGRAMTDGEPRVRPRRTSPVDRTANFLRGRIEGDLLTRALVDLAAVGQRPHCSDPGTRDLWLSEHDGERAQAALLCHGCPVFAPCGTAAAA